MRIHIVQKGDTLWKLAQQYGVDFETLKAANTQLANPDMIMPGMKIKIPTGSVPVKKEAQITKHPVKEQPKYKKETQKPPVAKPEIPKKEQVAPPKYEPYPQPHMPTQPMYDVNKQMYETNMNVHFYKPQQQPPTLQPPTAPKEQPKKEEHKKEEGKKEQAPIPEMPPKINDQHPVFPQMPQPCYYPIGPVMPGCACGGYGGFQIPPHFQHDMYMPPHHMQPSVLPQTGAPHPMHSPQMMHPMPHGPNQFVGNEQGSYYYPFEHSPMYHPHDNNNNDNNG